MCLLNRVTSLDVALPRGNRKSERIRVGAFPTTCLSCTGNILELLFEHNKKTRNKSDLIEEVRRLIRASLGNRAKESLVVDFIHQADLDEIPDKASVIEAFFTYARAEQQREAQALIADESLNSEAAKRYIANSLRREFASDSGTELNAILPRMSPLNPQYLSKKHSVFQKIAAFVEKFKGVGGEI
jgi:type I restriction enzyme R subunit